MGEWDTERSTEPAPLSGTERLTRELRGWIEDLDAAEPAPDIRDDALLEVIRQPAQLELIGALIGLKQEAGLQGRAFRELSRQVETMREAAETSREGLEQALIEHSEQLERVLTENGEQVRREVAAASEVIWKTEAAPRPEPVDPVALARSLEEARARGREENLTDLLDVRDRLSRGLEDARRRLAGLRGLRALFSDRTVLEAVVDGLRLSLDRLDDLLRRLEVQEVPVLQGTFDPATMQAFEVEERADLPEGQVMEVLRPGYKRGSRLIRAAEVRVSRRPGGG